MGGGKRGYWGYGRRGKGLLGGGMGGGERGYWEEGKGVNNVMGVMGRGERGYWEGYGRRAWM